MITKSFHWFLTIYACISIFVLFDGSGSRSVYLPGCQWVNLFFPYSIIPQIDTFFNSIYFFSIPTNFNLFEHTLDLRITQVRV